MKNINRSKPYEPEILEKLHKLQLEMLQDLASICKKYNLQYFAVFGTALGAERHKGFIPWDDDIDVGMLREDYEIFVKVVEREKGDKYQIMTPEIDKRYACNVTKFQRKGTQFISHLSEKLDCDQCIFIDIFPFDCVAPTLKQAKKQQLVTLFLDRLLYLCGSSHPIIPYTGVKYATAFIICWCTHYFLKLIRLSPQVIYKMFEKECKRYNCQKTGVVTSFGEAISLRYRMSVKNMFPVKSVKFEDVSIDVLNNDFEHLEKTYGDWSKLPSEDQRVNHAPYVVNFGECFQEVEKP